MLIKGFQGTSLLDFPGRVSSLVFTGSCNLSCGFCHNPGLVLDPDQYPDYPLDELLDELTQRRSFIDGVVISGGEPTLATGLAGFLEQIKDLGLQVKLDSNGLLPQVLSSLLERKLVDYLAMDLKTAISDYDQFVEWSDPEKIRQSIAMVMAEAKDYEFRTTVVESYHTDELMLEAFQEIKGAKRLFLQAFVPKDELPDPTYTKMKRTPVGRMDELAALAEGYADEVIIRGR